jgi:hypothetical protein
MMRRVAQAALFLAAFMLLQAPRASSQPMPMQFPEMVSAANLIVRGQVIEKRADWISSSDGTGIVTSIVLRVERSLKGDAGAQISLEFLGGTIGDVRLTLSHVPTFEVGDRAVFFLDTTELFVSPIVGSELGLFPIIAGADGAGDIVLNHAGVQFSSVAEIGVQGVEDSVSAGALPLARFESDIVQAVGGSR